MSDEDEIAEELFHLKIHGEGVVVDKKITRDQLRRIFNIILTTENLQ